MEKVVCAMDREIGAVFTPQQADGEMRQNCGEQEWVKEAIHHVVKLLDRAWKINTAFPPFCKLN